MTKFTVNQIIQAVLVGIIFIFCLGFLWTGGELEGRTGIIETAGYVMEKGGETPIATDDPDRLCDILAKPFPETIRKNEVLVTGQEINIRDILRVRLPGEEDYLDGSSESGFYIVIKDITDQEGNSYLAVNNEAVLSYQPDTSRVTFYQPGIYKVKGVLWGDYGRKQSWETQVAVETE